MRTIKFILVILVSIAVVACGGGGGGSSSSASSTISGIVAKGPIGDAEVLVFKAGDYSGPADDSKALNYSSPAPTDSTGHYSVTVSYSGPVVVVVRPGSSSTMCDELTGSCALVFDFRMRAALSSLVANTTANITPFTEMAASAVGTSTSAVVIDIANAVVRTKVLPGLDPLTTSPVVDSRVDPSIQAVQKQMVVALAAVAEVGNSAITNTAGTACNTLTGADQIACAVDALGSTFTTATTSGATMNGAHVAAFKAAMAALTTIYVPELDSSGALTTSTTLDTTTDADAIAVATGVAGDSTTSGVVTPPSTTTLSGVDKAKAFFSDLRTTLHLFANSAQTGLLNLQGTRIQTDISNVIAPDMTKATNRLKHLIKGAGLFGQTIGTTKSGGGFPNDFTCSLTDTTHVTCLSRSGYAVTGTTNYLQMVLTSTGSTSLTYTATAMQCTSNGTGGSAITGSGNWPGCSDAPGSARTDKAVGSGSASWTIDTSGSITGTAGDPSGLTINNGTFPGSNTGVIQDSVTLSGALSGPANGSQRFDISGSVSSYGGTGTTPDATPMVTLAIGAGSYATDQQVVHTKFLSTYTCTISGCTPVYVNCTVGCTYAEMSALNVILVANTPDTKFTGTLTMGAAKFDKSGTVWSPTTAKFIGTISDTSGGGAGEFMTGELDVATSNFSSFDANTPTSSSNYLLATGKFTGTLVFPSAQPIDLVIAGSTAGYTAGGTVGNVNMTFSYGNGKSISLASTQINSASSARSVTLTNQDGLTLTLTQGQNATVKVGGITVATIDGSNNMINYSDGYVESLY